MGSTLPEYSPSAFADRLGASRHVVRGEGVVERLYGHYESLRQWNQRLSLVGPGTAQEVVERHFGESLAALRLATEPNLRVLDLGSGAGFPGLVLAAARPDWQVFLVEPRERKRAFLENVSRSGGLSCTILGARVGRSLPEGFPGDLDLVTVRALKLEPDWWPGLAAKMRAGAWCMLWVGAQDPRLPAGFRQTKELRLTGSHSRRIVVLEKLTEK